MDDGKLLGAVQLTKQPSLGKALLVSVRGGPGKRRGKKSSFIPPSGRLLNRGRRILHCCGRKQVKKELSKKLILGSWNVRTLLDNSTKRPERQTALVALEFETEVLYQPAPSTPHKDPDLYIHGEPIKSVQNFTYLACVISSDNSFDLEITRRIQSAGSAFGALDARVWSQRGIKLATKCKLYRVFVLPCLLYSTETYTLYRRHLKKLTSIQL